MKVTDALIEKNPRSDFTTACGFSPILINHCFSRDGEGYFYRDERDEINATTTTIS